MENLGDLHIVLFARILAKGQRVLRIFSDQSTQQMFSWFTFVHKQILKLYLSFSLKITVF